MNNSTTLLRSAFASTALLVVSSAFASPVECDLEITKVSPTHLSTGANFFEFQCTLDGKNGMILYHTTLEVKNADGETVTSGSFSYTTDWNDPAMDDYNQAYFNDALLDGTYYLHIPARCIYDDINNTEAATVTNKAYDIKLVVGTGEEGGGEGDEDTKWMDPIHVLPTPGRTIDPSETDWVISFVFEEEVIVNDEKMPYLLFNENTDEEETIPADAFMSQSFLDMPKQVNANFKEMDKRENGEYTLVLPSGAVSFADGSINREGRYTYIWNGYVPEGGGDDPIDDLKLVSAEIAMDGTNYNLLDPDTKIAYITPENAYLNITVEPGSIEALDVRILDVTEVEESNYALASAIWTNTIDVTTGGGNFSKEIYSIDGYKLYSDRKYVVEIKAYSVYRLPIMTLLGTAYTSTFSGDSEAVKFSSVDILSIEPAPGSTLNLGDAMVITFSGPVTLTGGSGKCGFSRGNDGWVEFSSLSPNSDRTVWSLGIPNSEINKATGPNSIEAHIWGKDADGLIICAQSYNVEEFENTAFNVTLEENNYLTVLYTAYGACGKVIVSPSEDTAVESLKAIEFSIEGRKDINYSWMATNPLLYSEAGEVVAEVLAAEYVVTDSTGTEENGHNYALSMPLSLEITEAGKYTLELPWNLFNVGTEINSVPSAPGTYTITVGKKTSVESIVAENGVVRNADGFTVTGVNTGDVVEIFNLSGSRVASAVADGNRVDIECMPGMFIITINGTKAVKAIR